LISLNGFIGQTQKKNTAEYNSGMVSAYMFHYQLIISQIG